METENNPCDGYSIRHTINATDITFIKTSNAVFMLNNPKQIPLLWKSLAHVLVLDGRIRGRKTQCIPKEEVRIKIINFQRHGNVCTLKCRIKTSNLWNRQHIKKQRHYFANKCPSSQDYDFSSGHVWMWELDYKEGWAPKNWCFWTVALEKTLESPLDCKEIQLVHPEGDQSWVFIGRTDGEAETPKLWPAHVKSWLIWKDPDAGKDWGQEVKGMTEDEIVGCHYPLDGHGFGWTLGDGDGQGGLVCGGSWGCKESDTTERMNWNRTESLKKKL